MLKSLKTLTVRQPTLMSLPTASAFVATSPTLHKHQQATRAHRYQTIQITLSPPFASTTQSAKSLVALAFSVYVLIKHLCKIRPSVLINTICRRALKIVT